MPANTLKTLSQKDEAQAIRQAQNDVNGTLGVDGFIVGLVGRQITFTTSTTNVTGDTLIVSFFENFGANLLYTLTLIFSDGTQTVLLSVTRTA
jgi:hypothetical protein